MFKSAADEIGEWADQFRHWALGAHNREQRRILQHWEKLFSRAALEADDGFDADLGVGYGCKPHAPTQS
jgi:hypothetical protein